MSSSERAATMVARFSTQRERERAEWNEEAKGSVGAVFPLFTQARVMPWRSMRVRASHTMAEV
jgi:hypothetical protein